MKRKSLALILILFVFTSCGFVMQWIGEDTQKDLLQIEHDALFSAGLVYSNGMPVFAAACKRFEGIAEECEQGYEIAGLVNLAAHEAINSLEYLYQHRTDRAWVAVAQDLAYLSALMVRLMPLFDFNVVDMAAQASPVAGDELTLEDIQRLHNLFEPPEAYWS